MPAAMTPTNTPTNAPNGSAFRNSTRTPRLRLPLVTIFPPRQVRPGSDRRPQHNPLSPLIQRKYRSRCCPHALAPSSSQVETIVTWPRPQKMHNRAKSALSTLGGIDMLSNTFLFTAHSRRFRNRITCGCAATECGCRPATSFMALSLRSGRQLADAPGDFLLPVEFIPTVPNLFRRQTLDVGVVELP